MTASELLALVGLAWWRLFVYPGGIAILTAIVVTATVKPQTSKAKVLGSWFLVLVPLICPWLAIATLPLPGTRELNHAPDVFVTLALLDAPLFIAVAEALRAPSTKQRGIQRLAALLNGYTLLILAVALLSNGALTFDGLLRIPDASNFVETAKHWFGAVALLLALPALLNVGPFAVMGAHMSIGLWLRVVGLTLIATLPWLALIDERYWLMPLPLLIIVGLLWGLHRATPRGTARRWARGYLWLTLAALLALLPQ